VSPLAKGGKRGVFGCGYAALRFYLLFSFSLSSPFFFTTNYEWGDRCPLNNFFTSTEISIEEGGMDKLVCPCPT